jgi:hypothetical protein
MTFSPVQETGFQSGEASSSELPANGPTSGSDRLSKRLELLRCLSGWLRMEREDVGAYSLLVALTTESLKTAQRSDPALWEFDAQALAMAAERPDADQFSTAKRWIERARPEQFMEARRAAVESHFRAAGYTEALRLCRRSPGGKHRAVWYWEAYDLPMADELDSSGASDVQATDAPDSNHLIYELTGYQHIRKAFGMGLMIGEGRFKIRSPRIIFWLLSLVVPALVFLVSAAWLIGGSFQRRPPMVSDLSAMVACIVLPIAYWFMSIRPLVWLVEDNIVRVDTAWVASKEAAAQLEIIRDENQVRYLQLIRYSAVCPICAGTIGLRYSQGPNRRRLVGCCNEAPQDHVFSFDRVTRKGLRFPLTQI